MKALYLSNRPQVLAETLEFVATHMDWVSEAIVIAPPGMEVPTAVESIAVTVLPEDELLDATTQSRLGDMDHVSRNITLRRAAVAHLGWDEPFLLSDDDYRPLRSIPLTDFVADGRLHGYVSHDLRAWRRVDTAYDAAQRHTDAALLWWGIDHLGYGAHMPQVIHPEVWADAFAAWDQLHTDADRDVVDEWSLHHNWGRANRPELFWSPRRYRTLGWPQYPHQWPRLVRPRTIAFENFYPDMYAPGGVFHGLSTRAADGADAITAVTKIERWTALDHAMDRLHIADDVVTPWTGTSARRAAMVPLRGLLKVREYLTFGTRERADEIAAHSVVEDHRLDADIAL